MSVLFRQLPLVVVLLAAFVFSAGNSLPPLLLAEVAQSQQPVFDANEEDERPLAFVDCASSALVPVGQISFLHQTIFKLPVLPVMSREERPLVLPAVRVESFFKILFRLIISPNAP